MGYLVQVLKKTAADFIKGFDPSSQVSFMYIDSIILARSYAHISSIF